MKKHCKEISRAFMLCILMDISYCQKLFVKKYTTVEIACPFKPKSWFYDGSISIVSGRKINPYLTSKYGIGDTMDLLIYNFTDADQGRYMCQGIMDEKYQQHTTEVYLCKIPGKIRNFWYQPKKNSVVSERNLLCTEDKITQYNDVINHKASIRIFITQMSEDNMADGNEKTMTGKIKEYTCLILNADKCVTSNDTFELSVEWSSREEVSYKKINKNELKTQENNYTCDCSSSQNMSNLNCNDTIRMYLANETIYLDNFKIDTSEAFTCHIDQTDNLKEIITTTEFEHAEINFMHLTYIFGTIAAVLIVILIFGGAVVINMLMKNRGRLQNSVQIPVERIRSLEDEHQHSEQLVPVYLDISDDVYYHSVETRNSSLDRNDTPNSTHSETLSALYQSIGSRIDNTDTTSFINVDGSNNNSTNSSVRSNTSVFHEYVNTTIMNTYERLKNPTTDTHTYEDVNNGF